MQLGELKGRHVFGNTDADSDKLLIKAFESHPAYSDIVEGEASVILGRKGSGKTAIFKMLSEMGREDSSMHVSANNFRRYPWDLHSALKNSGVAAEESFLESWIFYIQIAIAKMVLQNPNSQQIVDQSSYWLIERFVRQSYGTVKPEMKNIFKSGKKRKFSPALAWNGLGIDISEEGEHGVAASLSDVNEIIRNHLFNCLIPRHRYFILFDQLDLTFSKDEGRVASDYSLQIVGLILAAKIVTDQARERGVNVHPIVFLRDDIYSDLSFEDKNKITEASVARIIWAQTAGVGKASLKSLMENRFRSVFNDEAVRWDDIFDEGERMPGTQKKYAHICDRTFLRPRDMIKFCNCIAQQYAERGGDGKFINDDIHLARNEYSKYLMNELRDELDKHLPHQEEYFNVISSLGKTVFVRSDFVDECSRVPALKGEDHHRALEILFDFSVIGYYQVGGRRGGSRVTFAYQESDVELRNDYENFQVHRGLKEALNLVQVARESNDQE